MTLVFSKLSCIDLKTLGFSLSSLWNFDTKSLSSVNSSVKAEFTWFIWSSFSKFKTHIVMCSLVGF